MVLADLLGDLLERRALPEGVLDVQAFEVREVLVRQDAMHIDYCRLSTAGDGFLLATTIAPNIQTKPPGGEL